LFALNSPFVLARADDLARRMTVKADEDDALRIRRVYALLFARSPSADELDIGLRFVNGPRFQQVDRWAIYAQALLATNEMMYLD